MAKFRGTLYLSGLTTIDIEVAKESRKFFKGEKLNIFYTRGFPKRWSGSVYFRHGEPIGIPHDTVMTVVDVPMETHDAARGPHH